MVHSDNHNTTSTARQRSSANVLKVFNRSKRFTTNIS